MSNIVPLIDVPLNAFWKKGDNNSDAMTSLRRRTKRSDGFFIYRDSKHTLDTFPLQNVKFSGNWRLGRIRLPRGEEKTGECDYIVEVYRKCMNKTTPIGMSFLIRALDDADLAEILRDLEKGTNINAHPSNWEIEPSQTFAMLGFDLC